MLNLDNIIGQAQHKLIELAAEIYDRNKKGREVKEQIEDGSAITRYLRLLGKREGISEKRIEVLVNCLSSIVGTEEFRLVPPISGLKPPLVKGGTTTVIMTGPKGDPGTNANIIVKTGEGERLIKVEEDIEGQIKTYTLTSEEYQAPKLHLSAINGNVFEKGQSVTMQVRVLTEYGTEDLEYIIVESPAGLSLSPEYDGDEILIDGGVQDYRLYKITLNDGFTTITEELEVRFKYPVLVGYDSDQNVNPFSLDKHLEDGDIFFDVEPNDEYIIVAHPESYGDSRILSNNSNDVTEAFLTSIEQITSSGYEGDAGNWTLNYKVYRLKYPTSGIKGTYKLEFI